MDKIKRIIENGKCLKLICGAGNENFKEIEKLSYIYSKCGFNMIDVCAKIEAVNAAKNGLKRANRENDTAICVSVGLQDDIHMSKAVINKQKCTNCSACISICPQNAIYKEGEKIFVDDKKCIGCSKCGNVCNENAILFEHKYRNPHEMLLPLISEDIDCVEFHCSGEDEMQIIDSWNKIKSIYTGSLGVCLDRSKLGDSKIINLLKRLRDSDGNLIIQADGKPMTGGKDDLKSSLQSTAFAELIRSNGIGNFLILSGGTNSKTTYLADFLGININGAALGSYARKIVKDFLTDDFFENEDNMHKAEQAASNLSENLYKYL